MELRLTLLNVLEVLLMFGLLTGTNGDSCDVVCVDKNNRITKSKRQPFWCRSKLVQKYPWTKNTSVTAPRPGKFRVKVGLRKSSRGKHHICLITSWEQKVSHLKKVEGYLLEIHQLEPPGQSFYYVLKFNKSLSNHTTAYATFKYDCCGNPKNFPVNPGDEYWIKLQAMPIYREKDDQLDLETEIVVPKCKGNFTKAEECRKQKRGPRRKPKSKDPSKVVEPSDIDDGGWDIVYYVLIALGSIIVPIVLGLVYKIVRKQRVHLLRGRGVPGGRKILVICSLRKRYIEVTNSIIDVLRGCPSLSVTANVRSKVEIGKMGLVNWCEDSMNDADIVVFLIADLDEVLDRGDCDITDSEKMVSQNETTTAVTVAKNIAAKMKNSDSKKKFYYVALTDKACTNKLTFCQHYTMPTDWKLLSKHLLACSPDQLDKNDVKNIKYRLKILKLSKISSIQGDNREEITPLHDNQNDLDAPTIENIGNTSHSQLPSLNITTEGHPSHVTDASYVTTDLNIFPSVESSGNYSHSGARPKV